jgi:DNA-binding CsgD family transcriptional regulator
VVAFEQGNERRCIILMVSDAAVDRMVTRMAQNNSRFHIQPSPPRLSTAVEKLSRLQAEFVSEVRRRADADAGAAMAHQLNVPLTALLLHLHAIKQTIGRSDGAEFVPASVCAVVEMALREAERVCEILDRGGQSAETPVDVEAAFAHGREAVDSWVWMRNGRTTARPALLAGAVVGQHSLTPREQQVLELITGGASNKEGGHRLGISTRTFEAHRAHLMGKLGTRNAADLVRVALATFAHSPPISIED